MSSIKKICRNVSGVPQKPAAQTKVWTDFLKQFPNADKSNFVAPVFIDDKYNISAEIFFKEGPGSM